MRELVRALGYSALSVPLALAGWAALHAIVAGWPFARWWTLFTWYHVDWILAIAAMVWVIRAKGRRRIPAKRTCPHLLYHSKS
jgi:hypothetical protein